MDFRVGNPHVFTVYEARSELEGDLYRAYDERLRELMLNAAETALKGDFSKEAEAIRSALQAIEVHQVW